MYNKKIIEYLNKNGIKIGDEVSITHNGKKYEGILIQNPCRDAEIIEVKLKNGYNIGVVFNNDIELIKRFNKEKKDVRCVEKPYDTSVLICGGTISSKVEYRTGAVFPSMTTQDFEEMFPEISVKFKVRFKKVLSVLSEDINAEHWKIIGKAVHEQLKENKGVVVAHGTDMMGYTAAAVSFMIRNPAKPVVFTGAQRSSDRGSSDNKENLLNSLYYAKHGKKGVFVCMHEASSDGYALVHKGTRARKMHTSRRDAFKSINAMPVARVDYSKKELVYIDDEFKERQGTMEFIPKFNENVALIWVHPNIKPEFISALSDYDGIVLAGSGLGHVPTNPFGDKHAKPIIKQLEQLVESGVSVVMAPQTIYGRINLNVYTAGRMLEEIGVLGHLCDWTPETAYVKLCWVLGQTKDKRKISEMMRTNYAGEISERSLMENYY